VSLLNQKAVRQFALDMAKVHKQFHPFTQVAASFFPKIEAAVRQAVIREVQANPSRGKTLE
jgi:hypothetical protein